MKKSIYRHKVMLSFFIIFFLFLANCNGLLPQKKNNDLGKTSQEVLKLLKLADFKHLSEYVYKDRGLQLSPYDDVYDNGPYITKLSKQNVKKFMTIKKAYIWGVYDGSGFDIILTPKEYYKTFIYDVDFEKKANVVFIGNIKSNTPKDIDIDLEYIFKTYPNSTIAHYYYKGSADNNFYNFKKLTLIFEMIERKWFLIGIIHGEKGV